MPSTPPPAPWPGRSHGSPSFGATTVAGGMTFNGPSLGGDILQVRDAGSGHLVDTVAVPGRDLVGRGHRG